MNFSSHFKRMGAAAILTPALVAAAGFGSSAFASTTALAPAVHPLATWQYQYTVTTKNACVIDGSALVAIDGGAYKCVEVFDGPKGNETAMWQLWWES